MIYAHLDNNIEQTRVTIKGNEGYSLAESPYSPLQ